MKNNEIVIKQREQEILNYQRNMFWHESEKQELIKKLLEKIYNLEDKIYLLKKKKIINQNTNYDKINKPNKQKHSGR